jgi:hypothetical protein
MSNFLLDDPNINKKNLTKKQIEESYKLTGNPKKRTLVFRPDLVSLCKGSAWAVLLYDQLYYYLEWKADKTKKPITEVEIYKFLAPCNHPLYKKGDSFCEELKITEYKFRTAIKKIGFKTNWKTTEQEIKNSKSLILYRKDAKNITWYKLNPFILDNIDPLNKKKKSSKQRISSSPKRRSSSSPNEGRQVRYNIEDNIEDYYKENIYNEQELLAKQVTLEKGSQGKDSNLLIPGEPKGSQGSSILKLSKNKSSLQKVKKLNGKNNKTSCKLVKVKKHRKKHKTLVNEKLVPKISNLPKLKKIQIEPNPLLKFNFPSEVFEVLNHWRILGGKIPKDPNRRKIADQISNQIQELLLKGNNPYTPVLTDDELDQFRTKKWTVQEIKNSITHYRKELCKPIDKITFLQFIVYRNYKDQNKTQRDFSPLITGFSQLPQELSYIAKNLKNDFVYYYPDVHFYDKSFINIASFLEQKLLEYEFDQPYGNIYFEPRFIHSLFIVYMDKKVKPKGINDELKYMANPQNLKEFIKWCKNLNLIKPIVDKNEYKKNLKKGFKNQLKSYQKDIDRGKAEKWNDEAWNYFEYIKEQVEELC